MNPPNESATLRKYALGLLLIGLACVAYNAESGAWEFYLTGKSGLIVNGMGALIALLLSVYAARGARWAHYAGATLAFMFLIVGFKNAFLISRGLASGTEPAFHWYKASLFAATAFVSLVALMSVALHLRRQPLA